MAGIHNAIAGARLQGPLDVTFTMTSGTAGGIGYERGNYGSVSPDPVVTFGGVLQALTFTQSGFDFIFVGVTDQMPAAFPFCDVYKGGVLQVTLPISGAPGGQNVYLTSGFGLTNPFLPTGTPATYRLVFR